MLTAGAVALLVVAEASSARAYVGSGAGGAPEWVPGDTARKGFVTLYDAAGNQLTGGSNINAISAYVGTSGAAPRSGATSASAYLAAPDPGNIDPATWTTVSMTAGFAWSPTPSGTPGFTPTGPGAFVKLTPAGAALGTLAGTLALPATPAQVDYYRILEIRVQDAGLGVASDGGRYWATDIEYNPTTATAAYDGLAPGAWRVVYPAAVLPTPILTTPTASPTGSVVEGAPLVFTTRISPPSGSLNGGRIRFYADGFPIDGSPAVSGPCTAALPCTVSTNQVTSLNAGTHAITAQYFTAAGVLVGGAASPALSQVIVPPPPATTATTLGTIASASPDDLPGSVTKPELVTGSAFVTVSDPSSPSYGSTVPRGSVSWFADGSPTPFATDDDPSDGFAFSVSSAIFTGSAAPGTAHSIVAKYSGATAPGVQDLLPSVSGAATLSVIDLVISTDTQYLQTTLLPGTVTITTPYTASSVCPTDPVTGLPTTPASCGRLVLPAMTLDSTATGYTTSALFSSIAVLDTRPGNLPYDVYAVASDLTRVAGVSPLPGTVSVIDSHDVGLTSLALAPTGITNVLPATGNLVLLQNPAADWVLPGAAVFPNGRAGLGGAGQRILHADHGLGTTTLEGRVTVNAPTSTIDGTYAGTITFSAFSA